MRYLFPAAGLMSALFFVAASQAAAPSGPAVLPHASALARHARGAPISAATSSDADLEWSWAEPTPSGDQFNAIAFGNGTYVAVGTDGAIFSSTDAIHWSERQSGLSTGHDFRDVIFAKGKFLAVHLGSGKLDLFSSVDGKSWSEQTLSQSVSNWNTAALAYANSTYLIAGTDVLVSSDGKNWHEHSVAANLEFVSTPVYANSRFAVLTLDIGGNTAIYYSADNGSTWHLSATTFTNPNLLSTMASNGSGFVLLGFDDPGTACLSTLCGLVYTSSDGNTWNPQPDVSDSDGFGSPVIWDGSQYLTWSDDNTTQFQHLYTSPDGATWTQGPEADISHEYRDHSAIAAGGGYVALGDGALDIQTSSDFANWTQALSASGSAVVFDDVEFLNGAYYAAGAGPGSGITVIMRSTDASTWTTVYSSTGSAHGLGIDALAYNDGTYVAAGDAGKGLTSRDGIHWTAMAAPPADQIKQIIYADGKFLAVGNDCSSSCVGRAETSPDGKTWTSHALPGAAQSSLTGVVFDGSKFVAVGFPSDSFGVPVGVSGVSSTFTSSDGVTWTAGTFSVPDNIALTHVRLIDGKYYAVGFDPSFFKGYLATSTDGVTWTGGNVDVGTDNPSVSDIGSVNGRLYMTSQGLPTLLTSTDGSHWSYSAAPSTSYMNALIVQDGMIVAVGGATDTVTIGAIITTHGGPVATDGSITAVENTAAKGTLTGTGASGATLDFSIVTNPTHGTVKLTDAETGTFTYTPAADYTGKDSFTFAVSDGSTQSAAASESITVTAGSGGNGAGSSGGGGGSLDILVLIGLTGAIATRKRMIR